MRRVAFSFAGLYNLSSVAGERDQYAKLPQFRRVRFVYPHRKFTPTTSPNPRYSFFKFWNTYTVYIKLALILYRKLFYVSSYVRIYTNNHVPLWGHWGTDVIPCYIYLSVRNMRAYIVMELVHFRIQKHLTIYVFYNYFKTLNTAPSTYNKN